MEALPSGPQLAACLHSLLEQVDKGFQIILWLHFDESDVGDHHICCCWGTQHLQQGLEHLPILLLGLNEWLDTLLLICGQGEKHLVLALVSTDKGLNKLGNG